MDCDYALPVYKEYKGLIYYCSLMQSKKVCVHIYIYIYKYMLQKSKSVNRSVVCGLSLQNQCLKHAVL